MSDAREIEALRAGVRFQRDRVTLLRAKLYRWGVGSNARLQRLERELGGRRTAPARRTPALAV